MKTIARVFVLAAAVAALLATSGCGLCLLPCYLCVGAGASLPPSAAPTVASNVVESPLPQRAPAPTMAH